MATMFAGVTRSGNPSSLTDYNGNETTYSYNSRNLETSRIEAYGSAKARTIRSVSGGASGPARPSVSVNRSHSVR